MTKKTLGKYPSRWVAVARSPADLGKVAADARWSACQSNPGTRAWTDDYANVTAVLHLR